MAQHSELTGTDLHEPKGVASATSGQVYVADGEGSGSWTDGSEFMVGTTSMGMYNYQDTTTATTPIELTLADTQYQLTNDAAGTNTTEAYALDGLSSVWDTTNNEFTWYDESNDKLSLGDVIDFRIELDVTTTSPNTAISLAIELADGTQYSIVSAQNYKSAGTYMITRLFSIFMGSTTNLEGATKLYASADLTGATVTVDSFFIKVLHNN